MIKPIGICFLCQAFSFFVSAQIPSGFIAKYYLDNSAADASGNGYDGTLSSTTATTNRFATSNKATSFVSGSSSGTLPVGLITAMSNDFSLCYWFKTSMTGGSSSQWYGGSAMVDAEVCGGVSDWGTALIDGGKVGFGIGNPDITIKSTLSGYNDGNWHYVTAVRNKTAGTITLYVDGGQVATAGSTNTGALTSPSFLGLGKNPCANSAVFTGSLDDMLVYSRVLTGSEITNLYNALGAVTLPLRWISFTGEFRNNQVALKWKVSDMLNNDHFEVEHSIDGIYFSVISSVSTNAGIAGSAGSVEYNYLNSSANKGNNFYRIKQVDIDGKFSYSTIIKVSVPLLATQLHLKSNPVVDEIILLNPDRQLIRQLEIIDLSGKVFKKQVMNSNNATLKLDIQNLPKGLYLLRAGSESGGVDVFEFLRQ